jgi:hypothetical protein
MAGRCTLVPFISLPARGSADPATKRTKSEGRGGSSVTMQLSINTHAQARAPAEAGTAGEGWWAAAPMGQEDEEQPVSPTGRLFREPHFNCYIVCVLGAGRPIDLAVVRPGLEATLVRHPRFCSVQVNGKLAGVFFLILLTHTRTK